MLLYLGSGGYGAVRQGFSAVTKVSTTVSDRWPAIILSGAEAMSENDVIVIFPIYGQFGAIRKPDSGHVACVIIRLTFSLILTLLHNSHTIALSKGTIFAKKS